jgi:hypothetical protein
MSQYKILRPYISLENGDYWHRFSIDGKNVWSVYFDYTKRGWYNSLYTDRPFQSVGAAKSDLDMRLLEYGHTLLTKEQYEKLKTLL